MDDHFIAFDNKVKCIRCNCCWKALNATSKRAHLSSKEFSTCYKITGCSGSEINLIEKSEIVMTNIFGVCNIKTTL